MGIIQVTKNHGARVAGRFYTGRLQPFCKSIHTEITFFYNTSHTGGKFLVMRGLVYKRPRIAPVKTSHTVRAGSHAETAADASMVIHGNDAVFSFKRSLGRTSSDAWGVVTMVAEHQKVGIVQMLVLLIMAFIRKSLFKRHFKDPLDLVFLVTEIRHIMDCMAGRDTFLGQPFVGIKNPLINNHP